MRVFCNFAISLDGRIADRAHPARRLGSAADRAWMDKLRSEADVIVIGAASLRAYGDPTRMRTRPKGRKHPAVAVVTASGDLPEDARFWQYDDTMRFVFCPRESLQRVQSKARDRALLVAAGEKLAEPRKILERLKATGFDRVLVEGGGELLRSFLDAKLLQELFVTLTPKLLGGTQNPSLVGGVDTLSPWSELQLLKQRRVGAELYLHYKVKGAERV